MLHCVKRTFAALLGGFAITFLVYINFAAMNNREQENLHFKKNYIVFNTNCKIPKFEAFHKPAAKYFVVSKGTTCPSHTDFTHQKDNKLLVNRTGLTIFCHGKVKYCEYNDIIRVDDNHIKYSPPVKFHGDINVTSEFIRVKCFCSKIKKVYKNFHAFVQLRKNTDSARYNFQKITKDERTNMFNVVMIGIDSLSRLNSHRQLSNTINFLLNELRAIELYGYNKIADNTFFNVLALLFGKYHYEIGWTLKSTKKFDEYEQILKKFRRNGYKTMFAEDASDMPAFSNARQGFNQPPTDYFFRPMSMAIYDESGMLSRDNMCVGGRLYHTFIFNYIYDFIKLHQSEKHFAYNFNSYPSHNLLNAAGRIDFALRDFFAKLHSEHLLNDTLLILFADHGMRHGEFRETLMGKLEERLPMMYIVPPKWFPVKFPKLWQNLQENSKKLTTPFDVHEMLLNAFDIGKFKRKLSEIDLNARGISLFAPIPENRTCEVASIKPHWCTCQRIEQLSVNDTTVKKIADLIVAHLNEILKPEKEKCATLKLHEIKAAGIRHISDKMLLKRTCDNHYRLETCKMRTVQTGVGKIHHLTVSTTPGFSVFESSVNYNTAKNSITMEGDISRLNLYGDQSICTSRLDLKKFCYCK